MKHKKRKSKNLEHFQKHKTRKAQLKMGENIAIMFIFILLVVFGLVFFFKVQTAGLQQKKTENLELSAVQVAQKVSFIPELRCSSENVPVPDCYDALKMENIKTITQQDNAYYYDIFKFSTISVQEIFPGNKTWTLYNNTGDKKDHISTQIPISIYDPKTSTLGNYYFGILNVWVWN